MTLRYIPDAIYRPGTPGAVISGYGLRPVPDGLANWRAMQRYGSWSALSGTPTALWANNFEEYGRLLAATETNIYQLGVTAAASCTTTDVSNGTYTAASYAVNRNEESDPAHWCFANFGQWVFASNKWNSPLQRQTSVGATFANVTGAPAMACMTVFKQFLIGGNVGDYGSTTGTQDMVAWSGLGNPTSWTPSAATQAGNQRLLEVPGRIVDIRPFGDSLVILKCDGVYLAHYVGPPLMFAFQLIDGAAGINGAAGYPPPIVDIGTAMIWVTRDDIVVFNGSSTRSLIQGRLRAQLRAAYSDSSGTLLGTHITHKPDGREVYFHQLGLCYNYAIDQWGTLPQNEGITVCAANASPVFAVDYGTTNGLLNNVRDLVMRSDGLLYARQSWPTGAYSTSWGDLSATLSEFGNNGIDTVLRRVYVNWGQSIPAAPTLSYARKTALGGTAVTDGSGTWDVSKGGFDLYRTAYWHQLTIAIASATADTSILGLEYDLVRDGKRVETQLQTL